MVPDGEDVFHPGFVINGTFCAAGCAIAKHYYMPYDILWKHSQAWELFGSVSCNGESSIEITVKNSKIVSVMLEGKEVVEKVRELSNQNLDCMLVEVAFSTNSGVTPDTIDWAYNSVLNESSIGVHIAVGDGATGAHIDFIAPGVRIQ
jgi:hypothetical protein